MQPVAKTFSLLLGTTWFPVAWLAYFFVPDYFPFVDNIEYAYDIAAYYLVDIPHHHSIPRPQLRLLSVCYIYIFFGIVFFCFSAITQRCRQASISSGSSLAHDVYIRTDVYISREDAALQQNAISSTILPVPIGKFKLTSRRSTSQENKASQKTSVDITDSGSIKNIKSKAKKL